jgi:ribosomal-protein-alanine N-acetyltransferase
MSTTLNHETPELAIRSLRSADLPRVMEIERASFSTPWRETTFAALLERGDADLFAAEFEGRLVGYAVCWIVLDQSELGNVAVSPDARGSGVGRRLVQAVMERVHDRGAKECFLEVRESNSHAQALYASLGFESIGRRKAYYAHPTEDALVMRKRF